MIQQANVQTLRISIHALREEGDSALPSFRQADPISIHALREEGDLLHLHGKQLLHISIHALREEGDSKPPGRSMRRSNFYPRPPRGGRLNIISLCLVIAHFYPRPPRGGRQGQQAGLH